jgi:hypothetical protein
LCHLRTRVPRFRKWTFGLILAGDYFAKANQSAHALGCYLTAHHFSYRGRGWALISNHIHFTIARQSYLMGRLAQSCHHIQRLVQHGASSEAVQASHLREFLFLFSQLAASGEALPEFPVPQVLDGSVCVRLGHSQPVADDDAPVWREMEDCLVNESRLRRAPKARNYRRFDRRYKSTFELPKPSVAPLQEPVTVSLTLVNPLHVPLQLQAVQLLCAYAEEDAGALQRPLPMITLDANASDAEVQERLKEFNDWERSCLATHDLAHVEPLDVLLQPLDHRHLQLSVIPLKEGKLQVIGVAFMLAKQVWGRREFMPRVGVCFLLSAFCFCFLLSLLPSSSSLSCSSSCSSCSFLVFSLGDVFRLCDCCVIDALLGKTERVPSWIRAYQSV